MTGISPSVLPSGWKVRVHAIDENAKSDIKYPRPVESLAEVPLEHTD